MPANSGHVTYLLSMLCVLIKILSPDSAKKKKNGLRVLNLHFRWSFLNNMAVKGLKDIEDETALSLRD